MKKLIILIAVLGIVSCKPKSMEHKKPYTIIGKEICCGAPYATYTYIDGNSYESTFDDDKNKYTIGQVIN